MRMLGINFIFKKKGSHKKKSQCFAAHAYYFAHIKAFKTSNDATLFGWKAITTDETEQFHNNENYFFIWAILTESKQYFS